MLVTLEGLDGSGKTTVWRQLKDHYPEAIFTREPTDSWYGDVVERSLADEEADPVAELFLYCADHADHLARTIRPALEADRLVVADRYIDSRVAYQGVTLAGTLEEPAAYIRSIHEPISPTPDLTCYLRVDVETAVTRSDRETKFERRAFLERVEALYESIAATHDRVQPIDAEREPGAVVDEVVAAIEAARSG